MALTEEQRLRLSLGEVVPEGGSAEDTLFSDEEIKSFLENGGGSFERSCWEGWRAKAAALSNLVNVTDGNASRSFSDLLKNAEGMVSMYERASSGLTEGRTRIGRIVRSDT